MLNALKEYAASLYWMVYCSFRGHDWKTVGQNYRYCDRCGELRVRGKETE